MPRRPARPPNLLLLLVAAFTLGAAPGAPLGAQQRPGVEVRLPSRAELAVSGPQVRATGVVGDAELRDLVRNGFPARLHFKLELWSTGGFSNDRRGIREWDVIVRYDPLDQTYDVYRAVGSGPLVVLGRAAQFNDARDVAERATLVPMAPPKGGRYYYSAMLDVETLSLSDLDELERWLRGDLRTAVRKPGSTPTALTRGLRTLMLRLLGGERRHYEARSGTFEM